MASKLLSIGDFHIRATSPRIRADDYLTACKHKLKIILKIAEDNECEAILFVGDFFDSYRQSLEIVSEIEEILKSSTIPKYTIVGNHDIPSRSYANFNTTPLAVLDRLEALKIIGDPTSDKLDYLELNDYLIIPFHSDTDKVETMIENGRLEYIDDVALPDKIKIGMFHYPIGAENTPYCKGINELDFNLDVAIFGDIHTGWDPVTLYSGCVAINTGAITRTSYSDIDRKIQVALIEGKNVTYIPIEYPAKFNTEVVDIEKNERLRNSFTSVINAKTDINSKDLVKLKGEAAGYTEESIKRLLEEL